MRYRRKQSKTESKTKQKQTESVKIKKCTSCRKAQNVHTENTKKQIHTKNETELRKKVGINNKVDTRTKQNRVTEYQNTQYFVLDK